MNAKRSFFESPVDRTKRKNRIDLLLASINEWYMNTTKDFDITFVESLEDQFKANGDLSENQIESLENIVETWVHNEQEY